MIHENLLLPAWLVDCTIQGSIAIVIVIAMAPLVRRMFGAQAAYLLWTIVLLRLLVPWLPENPLIRESPAPSQSVSHDHSLTSGTKVSVTIKPGEARTSPSPPGEAARELSPAASELAATTPRQWSWESTATFAWLGGVAVVLVWSVLRGMRAGRLVRLARDVSDDPILAGLRGLLTASVRIKETGELDGPALTGVFRPVILLPLDWRHVLSELQLKCVLTHELGHFRRGDLLWRWVFLIVRSIHWFNPLVWIAERFASTDQEMACDEWVLLRSPMRERTEYGEALITSARRLRGRVFSFPVQAGMAESRAGLKRRIRHLAGIRNHGWRAIAASLSLSAALVVLTGPARSEDAASVDEKADAKMETKITATVSGKAQDPAPRKRPDSPERPTQFQIESKFVELPDGKVAELFGEGNSPSSDSNMSVRSIYNRDQFEALIRRLDQKQGVDLMTAPTVTTKEGHEAIINVIREFRFPATFELATDGKTPPTPSAFETFDLGVILNIEPRLTLYGGIEILVQPEVADFRGFVNFGGSRAAKQNLDGDALEDTYEGSELGVINQPIFSVRKTRTVVTLRDGETILLGGLQREDIQKVKDTSTGVESDEKIRRVLFVFVTVTAIGPDGSPVNSRQASAPKAAPPVWISPQPIKDGGMFYGIPVPGKPGFAMSPYAPRAGYVDLRGFRANTEVKDPYTGQIFLVPASEGAAATPDPSPDPATPLGKASRIMIPAIEFKDTDFRDALDALKNKSASLDMESEPGKRGINLVLKLTKGSAAASGKITAKLKDISLLEALRFVAATNDLVVVGESYAVSIQPKEVGPLITRSYQAPRELQSALQATKDSDMKSYWRAHGLDFPPGAYVAFRAPAEVVLRNTKEEHQKLQRALGGEQPSN